MSDNYADAPMSIGELKSSRHDDCRMITERELLVEILRGIDRGEIKPDGLMIIWQTKREGNFMAKARRSNLTVLESCGIMEVVKYDILAVST